MMIDRRIRIVTDSSSDMRALGDFPFATAALKIVTAEHEYVDDESLDVTGMVGDLLAYKGKSSTSCPSVGDWLAAFGDADEIYVITITANLSGSYNSACVAARDYEASNEGARVHVVNSRSTAGEMVLVAERIAELVEGGADFDSVCAEIARYSHEETGLLFMLESMQNLANNGRVSHLAAKFAGILGVRAIGKASVEGTLEMLDKCRGTHRAVETIYERMKSFGYSGGRVRISHCLNPDAATKLESLLRADYPNADVSVLACRGLCSFYAEKGGMLVGYEKSPD